MQTVRVGELVDEARLAHTGLSNERHNLTMTVAGELLDAAELLKFGIATDEPRQPASGARLESGPRRACPCHFVDIHRVGEPLHRHRAERLHGDEAFHHLQRRLSQEDATRARELFHARRQVRRPADGRVVHVQIAADGAYHDLTGVEADADLHVHAVSPAGDLGVALDPLLHAQRRVAGPHRVVLVGERRAEERHDAVAHHQADGALVVMDGLHHVFEDRVEEFARLLGITFGQQLHRALEVGEKHRHLLALAFEC